MAIDYSKVSSPCYVLDETLLRRNLGIIKSVADSAEVEIILAFKGFAMWSVFPIVKEYFSGATASSLNEARLCFEEMGTKAHTYAPAYTDAELKDLTIYSSHLTFNSLNQFHQFKDVIGDKISCGLRVNPEYSDVFTSLYNPASPHSRLGVTAEHLKNGLPNDIEGLHFHVLCESSSYALEKAIESFEHRFGHLFNQIKWVNMGGGHLMTRKDYDIPHLVSILKNFREKHGLQVILEPGSAFAWETGDLISTVLDIVENNGIKTAILDVSFTCHMPDCLEMPYKPNVVGASKNLIPGKPTYRLGGLSCLAGDFIEEYSFDNELRVGDRVIFKDMIHYTMVKTTTFNGVAHPSIGIWKVDSTFELVRKFGYDDYKNRLS
ncbi:MAG: carboxynorspermidine decarboxylase [Bacteroidetes bacterium]|nr:carboxynorspermidine decarboxylase [Bacteroidota bacterium]MDA1118904.1 carboxynorspermidine decarboxylase [Bacteroidota bacterium]